MSEVSRLPLHRMVNVFKISISYCLHLLVLQSLFILFQSGPQKLEGISVLLNVSILTVLIAPVFGLFWTEWCVPGNDNHMLTGGFYFSFFFPFFFKFFPFMHALILQTIVWSQLKH